MFEYKRIIIIGCCGAGKSTFAKKLSAHTGIPLYHLDNIYWRADQSHLAHRDFLKKQKEIMKSKQWIIDGNYGKTMEYRIRKCDLIFFFDLPATVCIEGVLKREPNRSDIACELEPDEALLDYIKSYETTSRPTVLRRIKRHPRKKLICFRSRLEADDYLANLKTETIE